MDDSYSHNAEWKELGIWDLIKFKSRVKKTINKMEKQPTEWEKIFANNMSGELIWKINTKFMQLNISKRKQPV